MKLGSLSTIQLALASAVFAVTVTGCTGGDRELDTVELESDGSETEGTAPRCTPTEQEDCHVPLAEHNGVLSCYDGVRTCAEDGTWGACGSGVPVSLPLPEDLSGRRLLALVDSRECDGNPCDPACRQFPDVPDAAGSDSLIVRTSPFDWETGSLSQYPKGLVNKGLKEPCYSGSDCQFNSYCINPATEECTHDKCLAGAALISSCDPCVEMVCASNPECCTGYTGGCSHDLGAVGEPLRISCDTCVREICETPGFEYCCDQDGGSWDDACIEEVANTCGGTVSCCEGEVPFGDRCYYLETSSKSWTDARSACQARGTGWELAAISSSAENDFAYGLNDNEHTWIGLTSGNGVSSGDDWKWSSGDPSGTWKESTRAGHPFNAFVSGEPGSSDVCARINDGEDGAWDGRGCSSTYDSLCEGPPSCGGGPGAEEPPAACEHDPCQVGTALKANCDACVQAVCAEDPDCCDPDEAWTAECIALVATECTATCECADDESSLDGHCYSRHTSNASWSTALSNCRARGTGWDLVSIGDSDENTFVRNLNGSNDTWIGFTENSTYGGSSNRWVWTNADPAGYWRENGQWDGVSYRNWSSGEPNGSGTCARMSANSGGLWADSSCTSSYDYICEAPFGRTLSEFVPVSSGSSGGSVSYGSGGGSVDIGAWTEECVEHVASVCDAQCGVAEDQGSAICVPWYPGQTDPSCSGIDLTVGVACDENIPVCNHGTETAPAGVRIVHFPANSNQYPKCQPDTSHPQMHECFTQEEIQPGACINVQGCPQMIGNREIMVNPEGDAHVAECSCLDNWGLYSGSSCGPPVCSGGTNVATMKKRPIDIIISVDNSASMQGEIAAIQQRINLDFAQIIEASAIDYRVIMVTRYGNVHVENYDGGGPYSSAFSLCVGSPLSTLVCPTSSTATTPAVAHNSPKFFHHSTDIGSRDMWCKLMGSFSESDPYPSARTGFTPIAPNGWQPYLRSDSFKVFVGITDDSPGTNTSGTNGSCTTASQLTNNLAGAEAFDEALRTLSPEHFGSYDATDPDQDRNYMWYSIVGMAGNHVSDPSPLEPSAAAETRCCRSDGTSTSTCPGSTGADGDGAGNGVGYQELSKMTGGLRYPSCYNDNFDDVFNAIAQGVILGAQVSCNFQLQNPGSFDIDTAKVFFQKTTNGQVQELVRASDLQSCTSDGWYLPDANTPDVVALCPAACREAQSSPESRLSVEVGCLGTGYEPYSFSEAYVAECRPDQVPQWGFVSIDAVTSGDSNVGLRVRTADVEDDLADTAYLPLATLSAANGNSVCSSPEVNGCPLDLYVALGGAPLAHHSVIEVEVTMTPTSDKSTLPTLENWSVSYTCVDAE